MLKLATGFGAGGAGIVRVKVPCAAGICPSVIWNTMSPAGASLWTATDKESPSALAETSTELGVSTAQVGTSPAGSLVETPAESKGSAVKTVDCPCEIFIWSPMMTNFTALCRRRLRRHMLNKARMVSSITPDATSSPALRSRQPWTKSAPPPAS